MSGKSEVLAQAGEVMHNDELRTTASIDRNGFFLKGFNKHFLFEL
ncbi:hypothetical protein JCM19231_2156 [Vibrio ishigakensis]|nr:hypothetical protein JCM19231_2156 [Vibrio ishigakensis]